MAEFGSVSPPGMKAGISDNFGDNVENLLLFFGACKLGVLVSADPGVNTEDDAALNFFFAEPTVAEAPAAGESN